MNSELLISATLWVELENKANTEENRAEKEKERHILGNYF